MYHLAAKGNVLTLRSFHFTFCYLILISHVFDSLLPGPDVPEPDAADGDEHHDRDHEDTRQDGDAESRNLEEPRNRVPRKNEGKSRKFSNLYLINQLCRVK